MSSHGHLDNLLRIIFVSEFFVHPKRYGGSYKLRHKFHASILYTKKINNFKILSSTRVNCITNNTHLNTMTPIAVCL